MLVQKKKGRMIMSKKLDEIRKNIVNRKNMKAGTKSVSIIPPCSVMTNDMETSQQGYPTRTIEEPFD